MTRSRLAWSAPPPPDPSTACPSMAWVEDGVVHGLTVDGDRVLLWQASTMRGPWSLVGTGRVLDTQSAFVSHNPLVAKHADRILRLLEWRRS